MIDEDTGETIDPRELQGHWGSVPYYYTPYVPLQVSHITTASSGSNEVIVEDISSSLYFSPPEYTGNFSIRQDAEIISQNIWTRLGLDSYGTVPNWGREYMGVWDSYSYMPNITNPCVEVPLGPRQMKLLVDDRVSIIDVPEVDGDYFIEMENQKDIKECFFCGGELSKQGCWNVCCECDSRK